VKVIDDVMSEKVLLKVPDFDLHGSSNLISYEAKLKLIKTTRRIRVVFLFG
jgi:hypothetical protein